MEPFAIAAAAALALAILYRRPGTFSPALVAEGGVSRWPGPRMPDEEEQLPETDRAPRRWLPWTVAAVAAVRVVVLLALHA